MISTFQVQESRLLPHLANNYFCKQF
jgi:hypothetical protein